MDTPGTPHLVPGVSWREELQWLEDHSADNPGIAMPMDEATVLPEGREHLPQAAIVVSRLAIHFTTPPLVGIVAGMCHALSAHYPSDKISCLMSSPWARCSALLWAALRTWCCLSLLTM